MACCTTTSARVVRCFRAVPSNSPRSCRTISLTSGHAQPTSGPLSGVRVVDFTRILAGPWCTMLLGDMGADVIKVENTSKGDDTRSWGPPFVHGQSAYFLCCNRNKRSIALDIKQPKAIEIIHHLVSQSDIFVENFLPGKLSKLGYGYETLKAINPGLIYASISGFGADGPQSQRAGYDLAIAAQGGLMSITGPEGGAPVKVGVALTDISTGLYMHGAILAALFARERTGKGQHLDTSLLECGIANLANIGSNVLLADWPTRRWGTAHESIAPYQAFPAADGEMIVAAMNDAQFHSLCKVMEKPEWASDPKYETNAARVKHRDELIPLISNIIRRHGRETWIQRLSAVGVTVAPINSVKEALQDPQVLHRDMVVRVKHPSAPEPLPLIGHPVKYSDPAATASIRLAPPTLGQHTRQVLDEVLHLSKEGIDALLQAKIAV